MALRTLQQGRGKYRALQAARRKVTEDERKFDEMLLPLIAATADFAEMLELYTLIGGYVPARQAAELKLVELVATPMQAKQAYEAVEQPPQLLLEMWYGLSLDQIGSAQTFEQAQEAFQNCLVTHKRSEWDDASTQALKKCLALCGSFVDARALYIRFRESIDRRGEWIALTTQRMSELYKQISKK